MRNAEIGVRSGKNLKKLVFGIFIGLLLNNTALAGYLDIENDELWNEIMAEDTGYPEVIASGEFMDEVRDNSSNWAKAVNREIEKPVIADRNKAKDDHNLKQMLWSLGGAAVIGGLAISEGSDCNDQPGTIAFCALAGLGMGYLQSIGEWGHDSDVEKWMVGICAGASAVGGGIYAASLSGGTGWEIFVVPACSLITAMAGTGLGYILSVITGNN